MKKIIIIIFALLSFNAISQNINVDRVVWDVRLNEPYFLNYQIKDSLKLFTSKEGQFTDKVEVELINIEPTNPIDTTRNFILPIHKLTFNYGKNWISILKYKVMKDSILSNSKVLLFEKELKWTLKSIPELSNIQTAIEYLKPDSFWAFYNQDKSSIPAIDAIKAQFKDAEGILDIDKLGSYLKTKPKELEKYCDF